MSKKVTTKQDNELINQILFNNTLDTLSNKEVQQLIKNEPEKINNNYSYLSYTDQKIIKQLKQAHNLNKTNNILKLVSQLPEDNLNQVGASFVFISTFVALIIASIISQSLYLATGTFLIFIFISTLFLPHLKSSFNHLKLIKNHSLVDFHLNHELNKYGSTYTRDLALEEARIKYNGKNGFYLNQYAVYIDKVIEKGKENIDVQLIKYIPLINNYKTHILESQSFDNYQEANIYKLQLEDKINNLNQKALENSINNLEKQIELKEQKVLTQSNKEDYLLNNLNTDSAIEILKNQ